MDGHTQVGKVFRKEDTTRGAIIIAWVDGFIYYTIHCTTFYFYFYF